PRNHEGRQAATCVKSQLLGALFGSRPQRADHAVMNEQDASALPPSLPEQGDSQRPASPPHGPRRRPWRFPPPGRGAPDPGSSWAAWVCTVLVVFLIGLVALLQQTSESAAVRAAGDPLEQAAADI